MLITSIRVKGYLYSKVVSAGKVATRSQWSSPCLPADTETFLMLLAAESSDHCLSEAWHLSNSNFVLWWFLILWGESGGSFRTEYWVTLMICKTGLIQYNIVLWCVIRAWPTMSNCRYIWMKEKHILTGCAVTTVTLILTCYSLL